MACTGLTSTLRERQPLSADMPHVDARGLELSRGSESSRNAFEHALARLLSGEDDARSMMDHALRHDPDFPMGHALRAGAMVLRGDSTRARAVAASLQALERSGAAINDRERRHAAAALAWLEGDAATSLARYGGLVADYPRDILALQVANALDFRLGMQRMLRDRPAHVLPYWDEGVPGFGYVLGLYAFGLEETGEYAAAEAMARRSLELAPDNASAIHAIAHVMEMQGRAREGVAWLRQTHALWANNAGFSRHLAWHLALFHIDIDETQRALEIYDAMLLPQRDTPVPALVDASALLWRLELRGLALRPRWRRLVRHWRQKRLAGVRAFNLVHAVMAFAAHGAFSRAQRAVALLRNDASTRRNDTPENTALALSLCAAFVAFARREYGNAVDRLNQVREHADRCGGSLAQCDLIHLTLLEAALRSQRDRLARALARERAAQKPASRLNQWLFARAAALFSTR